MKWIVSSRMNRLSRSKRKKSSERMSRKTTSSNRKKAKKTMRWNRHKTTSTKIAFQAAVRLTQKRKKSRLSLRFNEASFLNRFLIQSRRLFFNEVRDDRRKHCSKRKNDRFSAKTKTSNCRLKNVVAQNFNEFFFWFVS
jgi:hypothetical protein